MSKIIMLVLLAVILLMPVSPAVAYIGPGAGISVLGSLLSILATIFVAIGAIIFWPLRKYMQRRKARRQSPPGTEAANSSDDGSSDDGTGSNS